MNIESYLLEYLYRAARWSIWEEFRLIDGQPSKYGDIFSFANYGAALALLLVVTMASDFRYRYRLSLTRRDLRRVGYWLSLGVGVAILPTDLWYQNGLPVPKIFSNPNNLKAALGFTFMAFVLRVVYVAVIHPPSFTKNNARQFLESTYYRIHEGNADRIQIIAEETRPSLPAIVSFAMEKQKREFSQVNSAVTSERDYARNFLLLIGDRRFCKIVVDRAPAFALSLFREAQMHQGGGLPIFQFARNVGQEFVRNTESSFYQEESGFTPGLVGYVRPVTNTIFGSYRFIERCATDGASPLDTDYRDFSEFNATQQEGFARAALAFLQSYMKETGGRSEPHSYALARMLHSMENALSGLYLLNGMENYGAAPAYGRLQATVDFIKDALVLADKYGTKPGRFRIREDEKDDIFDKISVLIYETITAAAAAVSSPEWTAWSIQHNMVWSSIFGLRHGAAYMIVAHKVRRLIYNDIKKMDNFVNFKGARILGYCLHVFGLTLTNQRTSFGSEAYPLKMVVLK